MNLFIDLETTGLPQQRIENKRKLFYPYKRIEKYDSSRIVQFSFLLYDNDGKMLSMHDHIIKPNGFVVPPESTKFHHITNEQAINEGIELCNVFDEFENILDKSELMIMHNVWFDKSVLLSEAYRMGRNDLVNKIWTIDNFCTMRRTKSICKLPSQYYDGYKNPKLSELHDFLFREKVNPAILHNSLNDAKITAKCFFKLLKKGLIRR